MSSVCVEKDLVSTGCGFSSWVTLSVGENGVLGGLRGSAVWDADDTIEYVIILGDSIGVKRLM
jgi:hypothetical protein